MAVTAKCSTTGRTKVGGGCLVCEMCCHPPALVLLFTSLKVNPSTHSLPCLQTVKVLPQETVSDLTRKIIGTGLVPLGARIVHNGADVPISH